MAKLLEKFPYYAKAVVPAKFYPGATNKEDVQTFGVKATFVTSAKVPLQSVVSRLAARWAALRHRWRIAIP